MIVFHENSEQGQHIPLLIIISVLLAWTLHVAIVKKLVSNELSKDIDIINYGLSSRPKREI